MKKIQLVKCEEELDYSQKMKVFEPNKRIWVEGILYHLVDDISDEEIMENGRIISSPRLLILNYGE